jgi:hypothetical protein
MLILNLSLHHIAKMARAARKHLADMRALEQMAERSNIVDPREVTTEELLDKGYGRDDNELMMENLPGVPTPKKGGRRRRGSEEIEGGEGLFNEIYPMKGKGATPTMGLSQVRGGKSHEAHAMGAKLRAYLEQLHGGAYAKAFAGGCAGMSGGAKCATTESECADMGGTYFDGECYGLDECPKPDEPDEPPAVCDYPEWTGSTDTGARKFYKSGDRVQLDGKAYETGTSTTNKPPGTPWKEVACGSGAGRMVGGLANRSGNVQQSGSYEGLGRRVAGGNMSGTADVTGGHCPNREHLREDVTGKGTKKGMVRKTARRAYEGTPVEGSKKRRAPAGANDGRRARAEIVKKVMAEKGLKMIEASKYVKQHNLY